MVFAHPHQLTSGKSAEGIDELTKMSNIQSMARILYFMREDTGNGKEYQESRRLRRRDSISDI
jgi:hypothetical protein